VPRHGYSVTIPPFADGEPSKDNAGYLPDANKLGLLNVGYVVSDFDLRVEGLIYEKEMDGAFIYKNAYKRFPAWVQPANNPGIDELLPAQVVNRTPNRFEITASGPGRLIVSEIAYPGWTVRVDGVEKKMQSSEEILMSVDLEPGVRSVEFVFIPNSVYIGLLLFCAGLVLLVLDNRKNSQPVSWG
jgi:hypothetical protein